jgi:hypothetical protein
MNSFTFGLWTGVIAGVVLAVLMKQSSQEPSMEEKLLGPHAVRGITPASNLPAAATPANLADALAQRDQAQG